MDQKIAIALVLFVISYGIVYITRPAFLFTKPSDVPREFGIGYKNRTILPLWLFSIVLGLLCYFIALYYVTFNSTY